MGNMFKKLKKPNALVAMTLFLVGLGMIGTVLYLEGKERDCEELVKSQQQRRIQIVKAKMDEHYAKHGFVNIQEIMNLWSYLKDFDNQVLISEGCKQQPKVKEVMGFWSYLKSLYN